MGNGSLTLAPPRRSSGFRQRFLRAFGSPEGTVGRNHGRQPMELKTNRHPSPEGAIGMPVRAVGSPLYRSPLPFPVAPSGAIPNKRDDGSFEFTGYQRGATVSRASRRGATIDGSRAFGRPVAMRSPPLRRVVPHKYPHSRTRTQ